MEPQTTTTKISKNSGSTQLEAFTPGVFIPGEDQTTQDNNSLSNLSSKGSTVRSLASKVTKNESRIEDIHRMLHQFVQMNNNNACTDNGTSQASAGSSVTDDAAKPPSLEEGRSL